MFKNDVQINVHVINVNWKKKPIYLFLFITKENALIGDFKIKETRNEIPPLT